MARDHMRGRLVDIGCGRKPYSGLLAPFVTEHIGVDHPESVHKLEAVDVLASAYEIPLDSGTFDTALLTEVLEHLEEPEVALREAWRLLRPGGKVILTTPFLYVLHEEPRDFYRYTPFGLAHLLTQAGFADVEVVPLSGQWTTIAVLIGMALRPYRRGVFARPIDRIARVLQVGARALDRWHFKPTGASHHVAVAAKPSNMG